MRTGAVGDRLVNERIAVRAGLLQLIGGDCVRQHVLIAGRRVVHVQLALIRVLAVRVAVVMDVLMDVGVVSV